MINSRQHKKEGRGGGEERERKKGEDYYSI